MYCLETGVRSGSTYSRDPWATLMIPETGTWFANSEYMCVDCGALIFKAILLLLQSFHNLTSENIRAKIARKLRCFTGLGMDQAVLPRSTSQASLYKLFPSKVKVDNIAMSVCPIRETSGFGPLPHSSTLGCGATNYRFVPKIILEK